MRLPYSFRNTFSYLGALVLLFILSGCTSSTSEQYEAILELESGERVLITLADTPAEKTQGVSGIQKKDFAVNEGMLFVYEQMAPRQFWMPNTFFDLDIFFLDQNWKVIHIERDMPAHPGGTEPPEIARTETVTAQYVLEMRADSELAEKITEDEIVTLQEL